MRCNPSMRRATPALHHLAVALTLAIGTSAHGSPPPIELRAAPPTDARPSWLAGKTVAARPTGARALDPDSGELALLDDERSPIARPAIGPGATQLVHRGGRTIEKHDLTEPKTP